MDFLDSLDLDVSNKKSRRVRSWYLYEQFKSLERNQLDAAQKLKDRSYQDRILRQELTERRARRQLYDQFGQTHSECQIERNTRSEGTKTDLSSHDLFESFHEVLDVQLTTPTDGVLSDACSGCSNHKLFDDDFKSIVDESKEVTSCAESVNSVVNVKSEGTLTEDAQNSDGDHDMVDDINFYFNEVKENLEQIEKLTEIDVNEKIYTSISVHTIDAMPPVAMTDKTVNTSDTNNVFGIWSKLVSFAYQIMQLNHGNCYVDYGSQFLTAVLACDVLRRGINRMCHILQPYVCPIKLATDDSDSIVSHKSSKRKKTQNKSRHTCTDKIHNLKHHIPRKFRSENCWQHRSGYSAENRANPRKERRISEPRRSTLKLFLNNDPSKSSYNSIWPDFSNEASTEYFHEYCKSRYKVLNPMMKLSEYFDSVLKEIDDSMLVV